MRIWSIHPSYLDATGLVALWRESLLAMHVLQGKTAGYKNHPQLMRFKNTENPIGAIATYLRSVADEADKRGYNFNRSKIINKRFIGEIPVTSAQVEFEFNHLKLKLQERNPVLYEKINIIKEIKLHPMMKIISGNIEPWEKIKP